MQGAAPAASANVFVGRNRVVARVGGEADEAFQRAIERRDAGQRVVDQVDARQSAGLQGGREIRDGTGCRLVKHGRPRPTARTPRRGGHQRGPTCAA